MADSTLTSRHLGAAHCGHLRHKGMYVASDPGFEALPVYRDWIEATAYWCVRTQKAFGPDGRPVTADACRMGRSCCNH